MDATPDLRGWPQSMPAVSVVVPLHNKAATVRRAVSSVLGQSETDLELIVVDDASQDGGERAAAAAGDSRTRIVRRERPGPGGHAARNMGVAEARSDLIAFLDADDEWRPGFLATVLALRRRFPNAGAYATAYEIVEADGNTRVPRPAEIPEGHWSGLLLNYFRAAIDLSPISSSSVAIPRKTFAESGSFPEGEPRGGDQDMWLRIALRSRIAYDSAVAAVYHREAPGRIDLGGYSAEELRLIRTALRALENGGVPREVEGDLREFIAQFQLNCAAGKVLAGDSVGARRVLAECRTARLSRSKRLWWLLSHLPGGLARHLWMARNAFR